MSPFRFLKRSLRGRIILLVGLGMVALAGILRLSSLWEIRELSDRALNERQRLAQALADHLDYILKSNLILLQDVALGARGGLGGADLHPVKVALREAYLRSLFTEGVFLLDRRGRRVWIEPQRPSRRHEDFSSLLPVRRALEAGRPEVSDLVVDGGKRLYAVVPIRDWRGELMGAVGGELDPESPRFRSLLHPIRLGDTTYLELVDGHGVVLASTKTGRAFMESDHGRFLAGLIQEKRPVVGTCHSCHKEEGLPEREREVIAFAPLTSAPWGVSIRQAEKEALAPAFTMERRLFFVGTLTILLALLFAWGVARSVTKPLGVLTQAAQWIARGDLDEPIPPLGEDEIGRLARSFDQMRMTLKTSLETIAQGKRDLEKRVQERTRELEVLYEELRRKEELRGELLKKVITAQEEERRRIARELHDETSQALATLLLSIETGVSAAPGEVKEKLHRMKAMADRTLDSIHRLIFDLRPSVLDDLGLASALRWSAESRLEPMGIDLSFEVLGLERRLPPEIETTLFRIGQEAISNIARHAEAEGVRITVEFGEQIVRLQVEDDGKGFDPEEITRFVEGARGLGLLGMKERAALLEGTLTIHSEPGKGTRVTVEVP
ncbi:MAG: HAMP domain-containing protein, partial [candidate division NC10 bacterium]|nr:HAMP domain-containing protein [candidate division NC10 bacterium]